MNKIIILTSLLFLSGCYTNTLVVQSCKYGYIYRLKEELAENQHLTEAEVRELIYVKRSIKY